MAHNTVLYTFWTDWYPRKLRSFHKTSNPLAGTWPSIGASLDEVKHDCGAMIFNYSGPSGYLQPASDFSSHEWLYAGLDVLW